MAAREITSGNATLPCWFPRALAFADMAMGPAAGIHEEEVLGKAYDARLVAATPGYVRPYWLSWSSPSWCCLPKRSLQLVGPILTRERHRRAKLLAALRAHGRSFRNSRRHLASGAVCRLTGRSVRVPSMARRC